MDSISKEIIEGLEKMDITSDDTLLIHSSYKSLGTTSLRPIELIKILIEYVNKGTILFPALSHKYVNSLNPCFDNRKTSSCIGYLPEVFRTKFNVRRSNHPTHSVCAIGKEAHSITRLHNKDKTPCGKNSPFTLLPEYNGKILMLGCGLKPNTFMHSVEEFIQPDYLFGNTMTYSIIDEKGSFYEKEYLTHGFKNHAQRYDRIINLNYGNWMKKGKILNAQCYVLDSIELRKKSLEKMNEDENYFVEIMENNA